MSTHFLWALQPTISFDKQYPYRRNWLMHSGSLTQRLRYATQHLIEHRLLSEEERTPLPQEAAVLNIPSSALAHIREIDWWMGEDCYVAARVVVPQTTIEQTGSLLLALKHRPLGEILFQDPHLLRSPLQFCCISSQHPYHARVFDYLPQGICTVWARHSVFYLRGFLPLLVVEIFLPQLFTLKPYDAIA